MRYPSETLGGLIEANVLPHQIPVSELDATEDLRLPPSVEAIPCTRPPHQAGHEFRRLLLEELFGLRIVAVANDAQVEMQPSFDVSYRRC